VPAAAVIPAPIAYIKVVAVKKLVVDDVVCEWRHMKMCSISISGSREVITSFIGVLHGTRVLLWKN
jgi:hypothetical protein